MAGYGAWLYFNENIWVSFREQVRLRVAMKVKDRHQKTWLLRQRCAFIQHILRSGSVAKPAGELSVGSEVLCRPLAPEKGRRVSSLWAEAGESHTESPCPTLSSALGRSQGFCCCGQCFFSEERLYQSCSALPVHRDSFIDVHYCTKGRDPLT